MGVNRAIFTHLGSQIVEGKEKGISTEIKSMAGERKLEKVSIVNDGMSEILR